MNLWRFFTVWGLFCLAFSLNAQNKQLLYDFTEIPQSVMINPGVKTTHQWHAGVPLVSGISSQFGSSGISAYDLFADDGIDINTKVRERVLNSMTPRDDLSGTYQVEIVSGGFRSKNRPTDFYSFGIYNEGDAIGYWFKDFALLGFDGNANQLGRQFDLGHLNTRGEMLVAYHFGINRQVNRKLTVGARAKIYSGIFNFKSTNNSGYFVTTRGNNNLLANTIVADMELQTSGLNEIREVFRDDSLDETAELSRILRKRTLFGGNLGLGFDLGFSYNFNEQTVFTASLLDLGFMYNSKDVRNFTLNGRATVEGVEIILPNDLIGSRDFWQELVDEVEELVPFEENNDSYISFRPTKLNASLRYNFGKPLRPRSGARGSSCDCDYRAGKNWNPNQKYTNGIGGHLYAISRPRGPQFALTAFYQRRLGNVLALKTTYTVDKYSLSNIGLGMNLQAGPVNFYFLADNLLAYNNLADTRYASFQLGLNIISWGRN